MPSRASIPPKRPKRPRDPNALAFLMMQLATGQATDAPKEPDKRNAAAVALGALGAAKGGRARAKALTPARKRAIAKQGARARWRAK